MTLRGFNLKWDIQLRAFKGCPTFSYPQRFREICRQFHPNQRYSPELGSNRVSQRQGYHVIVPTNGFQFTCL